MTSINNKEKNTKRGRPKKYTKTDTMQQKIDEYFKKCDKNNKPYTMSGLAFALDMDRRSLLNYSKDDKFFPTIKKARNKVETYVEERLFYPNATGVIFNLKNNFNWEDKQELNHSGSINNPYANLSEEELRKLVGD
ncbi:MAG: hypothetical protein HFI86_05820 [Bacilli bacterium]|nr:hypothetical protein [Bacilli bacterium]